MSSFKFPLSTFRAIARRLLHHASAIGVALLCSLPAAADDLPVFKIFVDAPGPYRVSFEDLTANGLNAPTLPSAAIGLFRDGHPTPVWVQDGGDGAFGPGDWLELIGELPYGWVSHIDEYTRYNVYFLRFDVADPLRMTEYQPAPAVPSTLGKRSPLRRVRHYENDFLLQRISLPRVGRPDESWYWAKLSHLAKEPFSHKLDLADLASSADDTVDLRIELRGWSQPSHKPEGMTDHSIEVLLNGYQIGTASWDSTETYLAEIRDVAAHWFEVGDNQLTLRVPKRAMNEAGDPLIDVVMLNWVEIDYPRLLRVGGPPADFQLIEPPPPGPIHLLTEPGQSFLLYGRNGSRMSSNAMQPVTQGENLAWAFHPAGGENAFVAVSADQLGAPSAIVLERPSRLTDTTNRADYIMIAHRRLMKAIQPLARFHRSRGLAVEVVDIQDVYDEFSNGLARPVALEAFLKHAYHHWQPPAPRFVLLVGDASLNAKDVMVGDGSFPDLARGVARPAAPQPVIVDSDELKYTPYQRKTDLLNRHLIPTGSHITVFGHAASDNRFVAVDGDDGLPDMAIGRLTVIEPSEVTAIVEKTIRYMSEPEIGPWRRNIVFMTNTLDRFHRQSRWVASNSTAVGLSAHEIYPDKEESNNAVYTEMLADSLNQGQLLVHYLGHGGRFIWETGQRDLRENRDLFTLDHLDDLWPNPRLPLVLSLTCFTAPFDHPEADSLGEKLLRLKDRGAVAVFAASQSNGPSGVWGQILLDELTTPGTTIGEAVMRAKRIIQDPDFVDTYNLLGDPAVPLALPTGSINLTVSGDNGAPLSVHGQLDLERFSGALLLELLDENLEVVHSKSAPFRGSQFAVDLRPTPDERTAARFVRAYALDASSGIDAAGALDLSGKSDERPPPPLYQPVFPNYGDSTADVATHVEELRASTVAWWSLDTTDNVGQDRLNTHHGSMVDRVAPADSPRDGALAFFGRGFLNFGEDPRLDLGTDDFTLQAWIRTRQARRKVWVIFDKRTDSGYHLYNYWGQLGLQLADGQFSNYEGPFIADGEWHHIMVSVDRDRSDGIRWFVDGREAAPRQDPTAHQGSLNNPSPLTAGGRHHGGGNFVGELDEIAIFRRALSARDAERLYQAGFKALSSTAPQVATSTADGEVTRK